jgi:hypothetical protein
LKYYEYFNPCQFRSLALSKTKHTQKKPKRTCTKELHKCSRLNTRWRERGEKISRRLTGVLSRSLTQVNCSGLSAETQSTQRAIIPACSRVTKCCRYSSWTKFINELNCFLELFVKRFEFPRIVSSFFCLADAVAYCCPMLLNVHHFLSFAAARSDKNLN